MNRGTTSNLADADTSMRVMRVITHIAIMVFFLLSAVVIAAYFYRASLHISWMHNEGWNAYHTQSLRAGQALYHRASELATNNYPPLSFFITAAVMKAIPDAVFAGRMIAALSLLGVAGLIGMLVRRDTGETLAGVFAASLFLACLYIRAPHYIAANDPQMLGQAVAMLALTVFLRKAPTSGSVLTAAALFVVSLFIKHNIVALPLAVFLLLAFQDRARAWLFAAAGIVFAGLGLVVCRSGFGPDFVTGLLAGRQYSWQHLRRVSQYALTSMTALLVIAAILPVARPPGRLWRFSLIYVAVAIGVGVISSAGHGTADNVFFELYAAVALSGGCLAARHGWTTMPRRDVFRIWAVFGLILASLSGPGLILAKDAVLLPGWMATQRQREATTLEVVALIARQPGPVLCEVLLPCYWAKRNFEADIFNLEQGILTGQKSETMVRHRIADGYYSAIIRDRLEDSQWLAEMLRYGDYVEQELVGDARIMLPRRSPAR